MPRDEWSEQAGADAVFCLVHISLAGFPITLLGTLGAGVSAAGVVYGCRSISLARYRQLCSGMSFCHPYFLSMRTAINVCSLAINSAAVEIVCRLVRYF